jgi:hypothetical protein
MRGSYRPVSPALKRFRCTGAVRVGKRGQEAEPDPERSTTRVRRLRGVGHHDRGARCAYRLALDLPDAVARLAVLDIVPTADTFGQADLDFARAFWVWLFLSSDEPVPEELIAQAPARPPA